MYGLAVLQLIVAKLPLCCVELVDIAMLYQPIDMWFICATVIMCLLTDLVRSRG